MGISVGIDLGTSNSVVSVMRDSGPEVLKDSGGRNLQPSVVALGHGGKPVVALGRENENGRSVGEQLLSTTDHVRSFLDYRRTPLLRLTTAADAEAFASSLP